MTKEVRSPNATTILDDARRADHSTFGLWSFFRHWLFLHSVLPSFAHSQAPPGEWTAPEALPQRAGGDCKTVRYEAEPLNESKAEKYCHLGLTL